VIPGVLASAETAYLLPFAPTLNSLTIVNSGKVTATFTPAATGRVPSFFVLKAASSSGTLTISGAASPLTLSGLYAPNTLYAFSVGANNVYGTTYSTSSGTIPYVYIQSPGAPTNVTVTGTTTSVVVNWTAPVISGTPLSYYIKDTNQVISGTVSVPTTTITLGYGTGGASFPANSGYSMQVQSINNSPYNGGVSAFVTGTPSPFVPNPVVQAPTIGTATIISNTQVSVAFTPPSTGPTPSSYTVKCSNGTIFNGVTSSPYTFTDTFVQGTAYTFQVLSNGTGGPSAYSSVSNSVTPYPYTPPAAPTGFSLTAGAYNYANLAWSWSQGAGGPVDTFVFYDSNSAFNNSSTLGTNRAGTLSAATTPTLSFVNYAYNTGYTFYVRADGPGGSSSATSITNIIPNTTAPPGTVTGVGITGGSSTGVTVNWTAPSTGGAVTYYTVSDGTQTVNVGNVTTKTLTGTYTSGGSYTFTVTPYNNSGVGTAGTTGSVVVWTAPPTTFTVYIDAVAGGGGGSQGGGGGAGGYQYTTTTVTKGTTILYPTGGSNGGGSTVWNVGGTAGNNSYVIDQNSSYIVNVVGGNGGGVANNSTHTSNRGNGGNSGAPTANSGAGGTSTRGGGGGGAGGAASGTANGGAGITPTGTVASNIYGTVAGGGGGFGYSSTGAGVGAGGTYGQGGASGTVIISWLTSQGSASSSTGASSTGTNGSYTYYIFQNTYGSITF